MSKLATVALLAVLAIAQGFPAPSRFGDESAIAEAASRGDWDLVHKLVKEKFNDSTLWQPDFSSASVRSLEPVRGGHVYGESEVAYSSSSNINGKKTENSGGHRIINNDGKIDEFDFKPTFAH